MGVIGGGLLGSVLAFRLRRQGFQVTLLEAAPSIGGLASSETIGGFSWDRFYHVILLSDRHTLGLIEELGLTDRLRWGTTRTGFYTDGRLHSMSDALEFLRFPPLSLFDKLRLGATIFHASRIRRPEQLEKVLATDWLRRWSGERVLEKIWLPLLKSKLGDNYRIASAAFIWAIIARMYAARRSGIKREMFGYLEGGYGPLQATLSQKLLDAGVSVRCGVAVEQIERGSNGFTIRFSNAPPLSVDKVVATIAPALVAASAPQLSEAERERYSRIAYQGVVCASILTRKPLSRYYVTNITDAQSPFTGVIEMTTLVDRASFGGNSLVYLPLYLPQGDSRWNEDDESLRERFFAALARMYDHFDPADVLDFKVSRARQVLAISTLDYSRTSMPGLETSVPGLFLLNSAQIAYGTLNVNETLGLIEGQLGRLLTCLRQDSGATVRPASKGSPMPDVSGHMPDATEHAK